MEFKQGLYDEWVQSPCVETLRRAFKARGADLNVIPERVIFGLNSQFRYNGRPSRRPYQLFDKHDGKGIPHKTKDELVEEGVLLKVANGHRITPEYMALVKSAYDKAYPEKSLEDVIRDSGYNPADLGDFRLSYLRKTLDHIYGTENRSTGSRNVENRSTASRSGNEEKDDKSKEVTDLVEEPEKAKTTVANKEAEHAAPEEIKEQLSNNTEEQPKIRSTPIMWTKRQIEETAYVHVPMPGSVELTEAFYNDAAQFLGLPLSEILEIYCIPHGIVPKKMYPILENVLRNWEPTLIAAPIDLTIAVNRFVAMQRLLEIRLAEINEQFKRMLPPEKKRLCEIIDALPRDAAGVYSTQQIREKIGISQAVYYKYLRNERYGMKKAEKRLNDIEAVRKVFEYKGFRKGSRQIYMLMPKIVGRKMGLKKIRRIMQENGMVSDIRTPNAQKRAMEKYLKENRKPNLLDRRFRLYRPNQVRLTDVTYIDYGKEKKRAYGSASIDPVTRKLIAFVVMETNDQKLADATLREMDNYPCEFGGKFHSDYTEEKTMPKILDAS